MMFTLLKIYYFYRNQGKLKLLTSWSWWDSIPVEDGNLKTRRQKNVAIKPHNVGLAEYDSITGG